MTPSDISLDDSRNWDFDTNYFHEVSLAIPYEEVDAYALAQRSFQERVRPLSVKNDIGTYLVDKLILVNGPSDSLRARATTYWEAKKDASTWWGRFNIVVLVGSLALTAATAISFPPIAVAAGVSSVANLLFAARNFNQSSHAGMQIRKWDTHPAQNVADIRAKAYSAKDGFFYAMDNHLKGSFSVPHTKNILHPSEVSWLYEQTLTNMMQDVATKMQRLNLPPSDKATWVTRFIDQNPLSSKAVAYAYDPLDPKRQILERYTASFEALKQDVLTTQEHFVKQGIQIRAQAKNELKKLDEQKELALKLPLSIKKKADEAALQDRNDHLSVEGISQEDRKEAEARYKKALQKNESNYREIADPIIAKYVGWEKNIRDWESSCLKQLQKDKDLGISPYFEPSLGLFRAAYTHWEKQTIDEMFFYHGSQDLFPELDPIPSAPLLGA